MNNDSNKSIQPDECNAKNRNSNIIDNAKNGFVVGTAAGVIFGISVPALAVGGAISGGLIGAKLADDACAKAQESQKQHLKSKNSPTP